MTLRLFQQVLKKLPWRLLGYPVQAPVLHFRQQRETILGDNNLPVDLVFHALSSLSPF